MDDYHDMDFVMLINMLDCSFPKKEQKPKYRKATQKDIDMIV